MFYQRVTAAISIVDAIFPRHDREHARGLRVHAHLSIQFVPKPARSPAHHHCPYRLWSRLSLISHGSAARLVCGPFDPPAFRSGDLANPRETGCEYESDLSLSLRSLFGGRKIDRYFADDVLLKALKFHLLKKLRIVYSD